MRNIDSLVDKYLEPQQIDEAVLTDFIEFVKKNFKDFSDDVARLSKFMIKPWVTMAEVHRMKSQGWKISRHSENGDHEMWLLKKGNEEKLMGY